jgi:hypothetical protein
MHLSLRRGLYTGERHPGGTASWIDFEGDWLQGAALHLPVPQPDHKWLDAMHHRPPSGQEESCPFWGGGHEWLFVLI